MSRSKPSTLGRLKSFFNPVLGRAEVAKSFSGYRTIPISPDSFIGYSLLGDGTRMEPRTAMHYYRSNSAVATAVDWIADSFEQISPVLQVDNDEYDDEPDVIKFLMSPNGFQTWHEFAGEISRHYLLTRNAFFLATGNVKLAPVEMYAAKPQNVFINSSSTDNFPAAYNLTEGAAYGTYNREVVRRQARFYDGNMREIYQIAGFSSESDNLWGDSPLKAAAMEAKQQIQGRIHNLQMLNQGGRLSLIVSFKDDDPIDDDEHMERKKRIYEDLSGAENSGKIAVISGSEVDLKEVGKSNKDMDYAELDRVAGNAIYMRYKIPLPLVTSDAATYNNMRTAIEMLYDFAVLPHADTIFSGLSKFLLPRFKLDPTKFRITYNPDTITALMQRKLDQMKIRRDIGVETINELRAFAPNRDDIEGGDTLYQPANLIPVGTDIMDDGDIPNEPPPEDDEMDGR